MARPSGNLARLRPYPASALAAWTLLSWSGRLGLAWSDPHLTTAGKIGATVPVALFTVLGIAVAAVVLRRPDADLGPTGRKVVIAAAVWSIGYWAVRLPMILSHHHPVGFKAVHTVLGAIAIGLSVWAWRSVSGGDRSADRTAGDRPVLSNH